MKKISFTNDPFIKEAIRGFANAEKGLLIKMADEPLVMEMKENPHIYKAIISIIQDPNFSPRFKNEVYNEYSRISEKNHPKKKTSNNNFMRWMKEKGLMSPEVAIVMGLPDWIGDDRWFDMLLKIGAPTHWLLNLLIFVLVDYGKTVYPKENHFSILATKFNSSIFKMPGWKSYGNINDSRKRIFDRYKFVKKNLNYLHVYSEIHLAFYP